MRRRSRPFKRRSGMPKCQKRPICKAKETYNMAKETYGYIGMPQGMLISSQSSICVPLLPPYWPLDIGTQNGPTRNPPSCSNLPTKLFPFSEKVFTPPPLPERGFVEGGPSDLPASTRPVRINWSLLTLAHSAANRALALCSKARCRLTAT